MANRNIFTAGIINGQYKKGTYYTPEGKTLTGIHVFTRSADLASELYR